MITWHDDIREWAGIGEEEADESIVEKDRGGRAVLAVDAEDARRVAPMLPEILDMGERYGTAAVRVWLGHRGVRTFLPREHRFPSDEPPPKRPRAVAPRPTRGKVRGQYAGRPAASRAPRKDAAS